MADPTPAELQTQIDDLRSLITTQYQPPSGDEFSYPVVGQPMSDKMWKWVTRGIGDGILDLGDRPYWLTDLDNTTDTGVLKTGTEGSSNAIVAGHYHYLSADKTLSFRAVTVTTRYHVCLTYDPTKSDDQNGPISVQVYEGTPPTTMGRIHVVLWIVERRPNELLEDATVTRERPRVAPVSYVWEEDHKPDPNKLLSGSICMVGENGAIYRVTSESSGEDGDRRWYPMQESLQRNDDQSYRWPGHGERFTSTRIGQLVVLEGRVERSNGLDFKASSSNGYHIRTLPEKYRPRVEHRYISKADGYTTRNDAVINIGADGVVKVYPRTDCGWVSVDGCIYLAGS